MLFHIPQALSSIFILFRSVLFFVIWSCLFPVCAVLCVNCFCASIAACAMQQLPWILQPRSGYNLMQHYKCRVHFLASHSSVVHEGHDIRMYHDTNTACFVYIRAFVVVCITCPFTSISMQQNGKNTASVEAFILGSLIQVSFSPLTRVINSQRAKWDRFSRGRHCSTARGYWTMLVPGLFSSSASCQWRRISVSLCDGSLAIIASLTGYECRSGFWGVKMGVLLTFTVIYSPTYGE